MDFQKRIMTFAHPFLRPVRLAAFLAFVPLGRLPFVLGTLWANIALSASMRLILRGGRRPSDIRRDSATIILMELGKRCLIG